MASRRRIVWLGLLCAIATTFVALPALSRRPIDVSQLPKMRIGDSFSSMDAAGDVNGDGHNDLLAWNPSSGQLAGSISVIFGPVQRGFVRDKELSDRGFRITGAYSRDRAGSAMAGGVDVNGDGLDDIIIGAPAAENRRNDENSGVVYVVFGKRSKTSVDLRDFHQGRSPKGFRIDGEDSSDHAGELVDGLGDANLDGLDDIVIGSVWAELNRSTSSTYVVFGKANSRPVDLRDFDRDDHDDAGYTIRHPARITTTGDRSVGAAGDVNGDGRPDIFVSSSHTGGSFPINAWIVFGKSNSSTVYVRRLGTRGFRIEGGYSGESIADFPGQPEDMNGDGRGDLIILKTRSSGHREAAYVVFGKKNSRTIKLPKIGSDGFRIEGWSSSAERHHLAEVAGVGDLNGDQKPEVLVSTPDTGFNGRELSGSVYVIFGKGGNKTVRLWKLKDDGFRIDGKSKWGYLGWGLAGPGDMNNDGRADVAISHGNGAYVIFRTLP